MTISTVRTAPGGDGGFGGDGGGGIDGGGLGGDGGGLGGVGGGDGGYTPELLALMHSRLPFGFTNPAP